MNLCLTCQQNTTKLQRAANLSDEEKSDCVKAEQEHLDIAQSKRECYRNPVQLVGTYDGRIIVPVRDWASFLGQYFRKFPNIKKCHHFRFS
ncbi:unnamed protein product [Porites lobata]|uniref:Uncharacterized protein n=1 Tax=Porites lobata TaxID=104759 RepID=A0ABN8RCL2_9CNID|nr:unnamed protein product [Porites lobata]